MKPKALLILSILALASSAFAHEEPQEKSSAQLIYEALGRIDAKYYHPDDVPEVADIETRAVGGLECDKIPLVGGVVRYECRFDRTVWGKNGRPYDYAKIFETLQTESNLVKKNGRKEIYAKHVGNLACRKTTTLKKGSEVSCALIPENRVAAHAVTDFFKKAFDGIRSGPTEPIENVTDVKAGVE